MIRLWYQWRWLFCGVNDWETLRAREETARNCLLSNADGRRRPADGALLKAATDASRPNAIMFRSISKSGTHSQTQTHRHTHHTHRMSDKCNIVKPWDTSNRYLYIYITSYNTYSQSSCVPNEAIVVLQSDLSKKNGAPKMSSQANCSWQAE